MKHVLAILALTFAACSAFWNQDSTCPKSHPNCGGPDDQAVPLPGDEADDPAPGMRPRDAGAPDGRGSL